MPSCHSLKGLYVITDAALCGSDLVPMVEQALRGKARIVQYRDKTNDSRRQLAEASTLTKLCRRHNALLLINDDIELARLAGADGVHLGKNDDDPEEARRILGSNAVIGISCYNDFDRAKWAKQTGANYIAFGRFFPSRTKPDAVQADLSLLRRGKAELKLPMVAIGGITPENGRSLIEAGADMLAVIHAVFSADRIQAACESFTTLFDMEETQP